MQFLPKHNDCGTQLAHKGFEISGDVLVGGKRNPGDRLLTQGLQQQKHAFRSFSWGKLQPNTIKAKTLILHGSDDVIIPVEAAKDLDNLLEKSDLKILKECGHIIMAEKNSDMLKELKSFLLA